MDTILIEKHQIAEYGFINELPFLVLIVNNIYSPKIFFELEDLIQTLKGYNYTEIFNSEGVTTTEIGFRDSILCCLLSK